MVSSMILMPLPLSTTPTAAPAGVDLCPHLAGDVTIGGDTTTMPTYKGEAMRTNCEGEASATMPSNKVGGATMMPRNEGGATMTPHNKGEATTMPSYEGEAKTTMPTYEGEVTTMPPKELEATMMTPTYEGEATMAMKGYKRHNPRAGKKKIVRGGLGIRQLFQRKLLAESTQVSAGLTQASAGLTQALTGSTQASAGSVPCITPLPTKQHASINQLKRKVKDMESQALKWNDRVIEMEVAVQNKDALIDKHLKLITLLNNQNSNDKKARNLVSSIVDQQTMKRDMEHSLTTI
jgi:hypothetical protein